MKQSFEAQPDGTDSHSFDLGPVLELPIDPDFVSVPPRMSAEAMFEINLSQMKLFNSRPGAEERRLRDKCDVPFEL